MKVMAKFVITIMMISSAYSYAEEFQVDSSAAATMDNSINNSKITSVNANHIAPISQNGLNVGLMQGVVPPDKSTEIHTNFLEGLKLYSHPVFETGILVKDLKRIGDNPNWFSSNCDTTDYSESDFGKSQSDNDKIFILNQYPRDSQITAESKVTTKSVEELPSKRLAQALLCAWKKSKSTYYLATCGERYLTEGEVATFGTVLLGGQMVGGTNKAETVAGGGTGSGFGSGSSWISKNCDFTVYGFDLQPNSQIQSIQPQSDKAQITPATEQANTVVQNEIPQSDEELGCIYFDHNSDVVKESEYRTLSNFANRIGPKIDALSIRKKIIMFDGGTTKSGTEKHNTDLGLRRSTNVANLVKELLKMDGYSSQKLDDIIVYSSFGENFPNNVSMSCSNGNSDRRVLMGIFDQQ